MNKKNTDKSVIKANAKFKELDSLRKEIFKEVKKIKPKIYKFVNGANDLVVFADNHCYNGTQVKEGFKKNTCSTLEQWTDCQYIIDELIETLRT